MYCENDLSEQNKETERQKQEREARERREQDDALAAAVITIILSGVA